MACGFSRRGRTARTRKKGFVRVLNMPNSPLTWYIYPLRATTRGPGRSCHSFLLAGKRCDLNVCDTEGQSEERRERRLSRAPEYPRSNTSHVERGPSFLCIITLTFEVARFASLRTRLPSPSSERSKTLQEHDIMAELVASSWTHDVDSNPVDGMNGAPLAAAVASSALPRASSSVFRQDFSPGFPPHPNSPERAARRTSVTGDALERVKSMIGRVDTGKSSTRPLHLKKPGLRRWSFTGTSSTINNNNNKLGEGAKQLKRGNESSRHTCVGRRNNSNAAESGRRARDQGPQAHESTPSIIVSCGERSLKGRKDRSKANEDDFFAIEDIFAYRGVPGLVSRLRRPADLEGGMVGAFGVFDGHGGRSCSAYVARNLPCAIANSPAWSTLNTCGDSSVCTGKDEPAQEFIDDETNSMEPQRLQEAMIQAMLDGFRRVQDEFAEFARRIGKTSGSTAVVALVCGRRVVVGNLGDSVAMFCDDTAAHGEAHTFLTKVGCYRHIRYINCVFISLVVQYCEHKHLDGCSGGIAKASKPPVF